MKRNRRTIVEPYYAIVLHNDYFAWTGMGRPAIYTKKADAQAERLTYASPRTARVVKVEIREIRK